MNNFIQRRFFVTIIKDRCIVPPLLIFLLIAGCEAQGGGARDLIPRPDLGITIGSLAELSWPESVRLEGYGLVGGLRRTGSGECPPQIRMYLSQKILSQLPELKGDVDKFISSPDTAVVVVEGIMPTVASRNESFDVRVRALEGTQTRSLEGGWLFETELKAAGTFGVTTRVVASSEGPVFIDKIDTSNVNKRAGYILAGGKVIDEYKITLELTEPDFRTTNIIRNRLDELFGAGTAKVLLPGRLEVKVPAKYKEQKERFISIVKATYITQSPEITGERIKTFVKKLAALNDAEGSEIALEATGNQSLEGLRSLLNVSNEEVRLRAARCMLNLSSDAGLIVLRKIAMDKDSAYRMEALEAITTGARRNDAARVSRRLLRDADFEIRLAAYEQLRELGDIAVGQEAVGGNFYLEQVAQTPYRTIFVSRSGEPRIVLFGAPIRCNEGMFVQSSDGDITLNAPVGQEYVSLIRKHPQRPDVIVQLKSSFEVSDIIRTLCGKPLEKGDRGLGGLGVSYTDMIALLKLMCDKGAVEAEFWAGPLPKIG